MSDQSQIEWTDATWNPITGCSVLSSGCRFCYAMKLAGSRLKNHQSRAGLTQETKAGPVWTGEVRLNAEWLAHPLAWTKPRRIFVCAHGDLFHEAVPQEWIDQVFEVMARAKHHVFQVLTKRAARMHEYIGRQLSQPLPNVHIGISAENQETANERLPWLVRTPAALRFVSFEPLLGAIDARPFMGALGWAIVGGESGSDARPMHPDWARSLRDQCLAEGVAFFFKQVGSWTESDAPTHWLGASGILRNVRDDATDIPIRRVPKKLAGRLLDGQQWEQMPT